MVSITDRVMAWDLQDIAVLRGLVAQADDDLDLSDLPSAIPVIDQIAGYPVWAIDAHGRALVGPNADKIETLTDVLSFYAIGRHDYHTPGYDATDKTVGPGNNHSSRINMPLSWRGKRVRVILLDR